MRVLFIGSVKFSERALEKLIRLEVDVVGVITKKQSKFNADFTDLNNIASNHNICCHYTNDVNSKTTIDWITEKEPDLIFCLGWSQLLKEEILNIPPKGVVGYHPSKLPQNRGRHPIIWAIALGLDETASTFFIMDQGADTGDIISQEVFPIFFEDKAMDVYQRMTDTALEQLEDIVKQFESDVIQRTPQDDDTGNSWRKRGKEDGKIDFRMSSVNIYNLVRALSRPYVGAHVEIDNKEIKVWESCIEEDFKQKNIEPGKILDVNEEEFLVKTGDSAIWITKHEMDELPQTGDYIL